MQFSPEDEAFLMKTACQLIRRRLEGVTVPMQIPASSPSVTRLAGCFISLHSKADHALRGCIGRIDIASPLLEAMANIAAQVAADPRFANNPITLAELSRLTIEISVLGPLKPAPNPMEFDPTVDGLYLVTLGRAGVFLPQVARESGWGKEQLLDRLAQEKLGVPPKAWKDPNARLFTFPTHIIGPVDFILT